MAQCGAVQDKQGAGPGTGGQQWEGRESHIQETLPPFCLPQFPIWQSLSPLIFQSSSLKRQIGPRLSKKAAQQTCHFIANYEGLKIPEVHCSSLNQLLKLPSTWMIHRFLRAVSLSLNLQCTWLSPGPGFYKHLWNTKFHHLPWDKRHRVRVLHAILCRQKKRNFIPSPPTQYL